MIHTCRVVCSNSGTTNRVRNHNISHLYFTFPSNISLKVTGHATRFCGALRMTMIKSLWIGVITDKCFNSPRT